MIIWCLTEDAQFTLTSGDTMIIQQKSNNELLASLVRFLILVQLARDDECMERKTWTLLFQSVDGIAGQFEMFSETFFRNVFLALIAEGLIKQNYSERVDNLYQLTSLGEKLIQQILQQFKCPETPVEESAVAKRQARFS